MEDIIKIVKSLEDSGLLLKRVSEIIQNETKEQKGFLSMLLDTLGASSLGNILAGKRINRGGYGNKGKRVIAKRQDQGIIGTSYGSKGSLIKLDF